MKPKTIVSVFLILLATLAWAGRGQTAAGQQSAEQLYKAGLYEEEVGGNLQKAIAIYQDILKRFPDSREVAAKAQLHIGLCFEKLGTQEAAKAFQKVVDNYPEQSEAVQTAKGRLARLLRVRALAGTDDTGLRLRQVWTGPETDTCGTVSPDGRYLSFVDWTTGDLAIRELATGTNRRLTNKGPWTQSPEFALFSKWAPDSRRIIYQWYTKDEIFELRVMNLQESMARTVYQSRNKAEYVHPFSWSPNGRSVLVGIYKSADSAVEKVVQLSLIPVDGGPPRILKTEREFEAAPRVWGLVFSPDGKYISYEVSREERAYANRDIFLLSADGGADVPLIVHPANDTIMAWTPDGQGLLFNSDRTGTPDMWFVSVAGGRPQGDPQLVKPGIGRVEPMGITSHGALFYGISGTRTDVYEVGIDPQTGKILSPAEKAVLFFEGNNAFPDYSPDGRRLAYISAPSMPMISPQVLLRILSRETGTIHELRPDLATFGFPRWAPDGRSISVEGARKDGQKGIFRVDAQTGDVVPIVLIDKRMEIYSHRWSKNGKAVFYSTGDRAGKTGAIFVHDLETGRDVPIPGSPSTAQFFDISPEGKWLALLNRDDQRVIRIMPAAGGEPREIYRFEQRGNFVITPAWSADGRYIFFSKLQKPQGEGNVWDLYRISADTSVAQKIDLSMAQLRHFSVHPDGQRIAFSSMGTNPEHSQVWVMENFLPGDKAKK